MIGRGIPSIQSSAPFPKPMTVSYRLIGEKPHKQLKSQLPVPKVRRRRATSKLALPQPRTHAICIGLVIGGVRVPSAKSASSQQRGQLSSVGRRSGSQTTHCFCFGEYVGDVIHWASKSSASGAFAQSIFVTPAAATGGGPQTSAASRALRYAASQSVQAFCPDRVPTWRGQSGSPSPEGHFSLSPDARAPLTGGSYNVRQSGRFR
jgi:hypothetical protein